MIKNILKINLLVLLMMVAASFNAYSSDTGFAELVRSALENNPDLRAADLDLSSEIMSYESQRASVLPGVDFTTDTGNNPLYRYSDANEYSTSSAPTRYNRHKIGGGLSLGAALPTGGSLSLTGAGSLDLSLQDSDGAEWNYLVSPAVSLYLRQPLFVDRISGAPVRFDNLRQNDELAAAGVEIAELSRSALENNLIILIASTAAVINSLKNSSNLLEQRILLAEKRLELALADEAAGRISSLDRLSEELQINRLKETEIELEYQIRIALNDMKQLTGKDDFNGGYVNISGIGLNPVNDIYPAGSFNVQTTAVSTRITELSASSIPTGSEPVFEVSALYRRSDSDSASSFADAFDEAGAAEMDLSVSLSVSLPVFDWGETKKLRESEKHSLSAAGERLRSAEEAAQLATAAAEENLKLIDEKIELLEKSLLYDKTLLDRELVRFDAGLSSEAAVETIKVDLLDREYSIKQLKEERIIALLDLYNTGGIELQGLFE
ncbi:MAG: TolC family protein [Spirochaetales bacterium]|uniref:TolC family protein n=1 Tax=Candidatus Thalassospirochaeta sargassi TaxID=3119039 RepID=A0AAJ1IKE6_9SPIO|nr:TolC family protein [Spirochaetales bacterium]